MNKFYSLTLKEVRPETRNAVSLAFDLPEDLVDKFNYKQGQHLIVRTQMEGEEVRRSYSICRSVNDQELRIAVKKVAGGRFSTFANEQLKPGQTLEVMPPQGHFSIDLDPEREGNYLAVAAGSALPPSCRSSRPPWKPSPRAKSRCSMATRPPAAPCSGTNSRT